MKPVLFGMIGIVACSGTAMMAPETPRDAMRAAIQQARDGDLQADWNKMLDARERFAAVAAASGSDGEISPLAHYYLGYTDWRLSSLAFMAVGPKAQAALAERAATSLDTAIEKRPKFPDAHALLAAVLATWAYGDPSVRDKVLPRMQAAWKAALPDGEGNPRVLLLRAMSLVFAPPPYGNREQGLEMWRRAIDAFEKERPSTLEPNWGYVEAIAWLGGTHLAAGEYKEAVQLLERAVKIRPDFWWARKAALPVAKRPIEK
ncbi:MAG TPA: tetratricopeptide repeat protein [Vicinamibacterales bacterium]|jgi:tetratricopeptide (TPR) repeat protein